MQKRIILFTVSSFPFIMFNFIIFSPILKLYFPFEDPFYLTASPPLGSATRHSSPSLLLHLTLC